MSLLESKVEYLSLRFIRVLAESNHEDTLFLIYSCVTLEKDVVVAAINKKLC